MHYACTFYLILRDWFRSAKILEIFIYSLSKLIKVLHYLYDFSSLLFRNTKFEYLHIFAMHVKIIRMEEIAPSMAGTEWFLNFAFRII